MLQPLRTPSAGIRFRGPAQWLVLLAAALVVGGCSARRLGETAGAPRVERLTTEHAVNPLGLDERTPGLSWIANSSERAQRQSAYRILVATDPAKLAEGEADVWDSGKVVSDRSAHVRYAGPPLQSRQRYHWRVRVWDQEGRASGWSRPAWWEMALLEDADWSARWISAVSPEDTSLAPRPAPLFRREFPVRRKVERARLYVTGLGYHEAYLNGARVGDHHLDPVITRYDRRVKYVVHDVTHQLRAGANALGVTLSNGWYNYHVRSAWDFDRAPWRAAPVTRAQLEILYRDGTRELVGTGADWRVAAGPVVHDGVLNGEVYDARREIPGWSEPGIDPSGWSAPYVVPGPHGRMSSQVMPPIRVIRSLEPVRVTEPAPGVKVLDFGENTAGWIRLKVRGPRGRELVIRYGERLLPDGRLDQKELARFVWTGDTQTDRYVLAGREAEEWHPRSTYHGFQYAEISGLGPDVALEEVRAEVVHSDLGQAGEFASSNELLNRIHQATRRAFLSNFHGYPTDCPHREKIGWSGDAHLAAEMALYNFDVVLAYRKWLDDFVDEQRPDGQIPGIIPTSGWGYTFGKEGPHVQRGYGPQWEAAFVLIPWEMYRFTGDEALLERYYEPIRRYVDYLTRHAEGYTLSFGIDDHKPAFTSTEPPILATAHFHTSAHILADMARVLGRAGDAEKYTALADSIRTGANRRFFDRATGLFDNGGQTALSVALHHGLVEPAQEERVLQNLLAEIRRRNGRIDAGVVGTKAVLNVLAARGEDEVAYGMVSTTEYPSWGHWIAQGATTLWQNWEGSQSLNHVMFGSVGEWFYEALAGIRPDAERPGFRLTQIRPPVVEGLDWVRASHHSPYGEIRSHWRRDGDALELEVQIPFNTEALVHLPASPAAAVLEGEAPAERAPGVEPVGRRGDRMVYRVGSGTYRFRTSRPATPGPAAP